MESELIKRALIVDDDPQMRLLLHSLLKKEGIECHVVSSAEAALDVLKRCGEDRVQLLLSDLSLPGMDGLSLCRKIRRTEPLMVTVALTGHTDLFTICECREAGFDDYLAKPVSSAVLRAAMIGAFKRVRYWESLARRSIYERKKKIPDGSGMM